MPMICVSDLFLCGPPVQYRNEKMPTGETEPLFYEILHLREPLVGSYWYWSREGQLKKVALYIINSRNAGMVAAT